MSGANTGCACHFVQVASLHVSGPLHKDGPSRVCVLYFSRIPHVFHFGLFTSQLLPPLLCFYVSCLGLCSSVSGNCSVLPCCLFCWRWALSVFAQTGLCPLWCWRLFSSGSIVLSDHFRDTLVSCSPGRQAAFLSDTRFLCSCFEYLIFHCFRSLSVMWFYCV